MAPDPTPMVAGMLYAAVALALVSLLLWKRKMNSRIGLVILMISSLMGFLLFSPMLPYQLQQLMLGGKFPMPTPFILLIILSILIASFLLGRTFCGYVCPIGAVQELAYKAPTKKVRLGHGRATQAFRAAFLAAMLVLAAGASVSLLGYLGIKEFFGLQAGSVLFWVFLAVILVSIVFYRPFCRLLCPYAVFLSLASLRNILRLRRNPNCVECRKCEKACPTSEAYRSSRKSECYMCLRCVDVCPKDALDYSRKKEG